MGGESRVSNLQLYMYTMRLLIRERMAYRQNYFLMTFSVVFKESAAIALIGVVLQKFHAVGGWTIWEVGVLYSLMAFANRAFVTFCNGVIRITRLVESGEMDRFLVTPRNPLFLMTAHHAYAWRILFNCATLLIFVFCGVKAGIVFNPFTIVLFLVFMTCAVVIQFGIYLILATMAIWVVRVDALQTLLKQVIFDYLRYPLQIYGKVGAFILTCVVPLAFVNYYPASVLLGKTQDVLVSPLLGYLAPVVGAVLFVISYRFWIFGLSHYNSTGT